MMDDAIQASGILNKYGIFDFSEETISSVLLDIDNTLKAMQRKNDLLLAVICEIAISIPDLIEMENGDGESLRPLAVKIHEILTSSAGCPKEEH